MSNFKIIICSNKANTEFKLCLSRLAYFGYTAENLQIYETSPVNYTFNRYILDKYNIPYINEPDVTYAETLNKALLEVDSPYALLLDSQCILKASIDSYLQDMEDHKFQLMGEITNYENYKKIHKRVQPWWCLVDINFIQERKIKFSDLRRIRATHSESINNMEYTPIPDEKIGIYYAPGSTMYEDIMLNGGYAADIGEDVPYIHIDSSNENWIDQMYKMFNYDEKSLAKLGKEKDQ